MAHNFLCPSSCAPSFSPSPAGSLPPPRLLYLSLPRAQAPASQEEQQHHAALPRRLEPAAEVAVGGRSMAMEAGGGSVVMRMPAAADPWRWRPAAMDIRAVPETEQSEPGDVVVVSPAGGQLSSYAHAAAEGCAESVGQAA